MNSNDSTQSQYTVVARRYRPQSFGDMVGQNHIAHALSNAIKQSRVGHAYLFTGARGVGKTSSARIFAKCLNCVNGPTPEPCNECDLCISVSSGEDIDVLEIDGASNRGIDEIRQLRSNAIVRPSRARFKIYIIDEVHMLTQQAFNALLKTLEEPPDHVKFIFCTTDPQKIPITVLSRCQRFDFSPVQTTDIIGRLREICENESIEADEQALAVLARRAAGSMRDSQSLLEQLLSFCAEKITTDDVHQLLGTADIGRISAIVEAVVEKNSAQCIDLVTAAINSGVDAGQLTSQLLGYFRDIMAIQVGASSQSLQTCNESDVDELKAKGQSLGLETILSIVQILDHSITRMQSSLHGRTLLEVAIVRICNLENLNAISDLVNQIGSTTPAPKSRMAAPKKKLAPQHNGPSEPTEVKKDSTSSAHSSTAASSPLPEASKLTGNNIAKMWEAAANYVGDVTADMATQYTKIELQGRQVLVTFGEKHICEFCRKPDRTEALKDALTQLSGETISLQFNVVESQTVHNEIKAPKLTRVQMIRQLEQHELVKSAIEVFDAEVVEFRDLRKNS